MFHRLIARLARAALPPRLTADTRGNVAILFAFSMTAIAVGVGASIDLARVYSAQQKLNEVATLACQYATRPSVIQTDASDYSGANGQAAYVAKVASFITTSLQSQNFQYTQSTATPFTATQNGPADVSLSSNVPTTFMQVVQITQMPVSASVHCFDSASNINQVVSSQLVVQEGFEKAPPGTCRYSGTVCYINQSGAIGPPATPSSTFPSSPSYTGTYGAAWYVTGYCLEIDHAGSTIATAAQGSHSAELNCDNGGVYGSTDQGNSAITTKAYLAAGNYELRYNYAARVDYPDYDPAYICGSTASDVSWANDTNSPGGPISAALRNNQIEVYLDEVSGASPPMHTTIDGTQQLAGANLIDVCVYATAGNWIERSVRIYVSTPAFYWLTFSADGQNDSYGGQIDNIRLCQGTCAGAPADNFPSTWLAANNGGSNVVLFEDTFESPTYAGTPYNQNGNMYNSQGTSGASSGWPSQSASGWALAPTNELPYWNNGCPQGNHCIELGWNSNSLISRPFLLDPGYYQVNYDYLSEITYASVSGVYCGATPSAAYIAALSAQSGYGLIHYYNFNTGTPTTHDTNTVGVFMSHAQLASTPNLNSTLNSTTSYTNPDGTTSTTPTSPPNAISLTSYNAAQNNPLLDICGYADTAQTRTAYILIQKPAYYWLTFAALGASDAYGGFIDDVKLTALGSPYMSSPPSGAVTIPVPSPQPGAAVNFSSFETIADPVAAPAATQ
jgi:Flp pilus assembly protein TadG